MSMLLLATHPDQNTDRKYKIQLSHKRIFKMSAIMKKVDYYHPVGMSKLALPGINICMLYARDWYKYMHAACT